MRASTSASVVGKLQRIASPTDNEREIPCRHERSGFRVCRVPGITFASVLIVSQDCIVNLGSGNLTDALPAALIVLAEFSAYANFADARKG